MGKRKCCCCNRTRRNSEESLSIESDQSTTNKKKWSLTKKILIWTLVSLLILIFVIFILIWVIIPVSFWLSIAFQRFMVFMPVNVPRNPDFDDPESYGINGVHNFYISVTDYHNNQTITKIGSWLILPEKDKDTVTTTDIPQIIRETEFDILIYLHGIYANRARPISQYEVFRKHFLVIAVDHRGYGDSGQEVELTELGIVHDHLQIYEWVLATNFTNNIYYWGHSLGAAMSCHTLRALKEQKKLVPKGLILESPFTTLAEQIVSMSLGKIFKWLPYFDATILNPLDYNGFHFYSTSHILQVNCPIMILHAEDDRTIPSFLGADLAEVATTKRNLSTQGNVTLHLFASELGYGHNDVTSDPNIPKYITNFKEICESFHR